MTDHRNEALAAVKAALEHAGFQAIGPWDTMSEQWGRDEGVPEEMWQDLEYDVLTVITPTRAVVRVRLDLMGTPLEATS